ncbi:unnamed protein product, partial [Coregonus sp. 'balchen']
THPKKTFPTPFLPKISKLQLLNEVLYEKVAAVHLELSVVVKTTIANYQEEISLLKLFIKFHPFSFPPDLQQLTLTEEEVNPKQQEWSPVLGPWSIWDSFNLITEKNQTESDGESNGESESTSDSELPSEVNPDSDNSESDNGRVDKVTGDKEHSHLKYDVCGKCFEKACNLKLHRHNEERRHMRHVVQLLHQECGSPEIPFWGSPVHSLLRSSGATNRKGRRGGENKGTCWSRRDGGVCVRVCILASVFEEENSGDSVQCYGLGASWSLAEDMA